MRICNIANIPNVFSILRFDSLEVLSLGLWSLPSQTPVPTGRVLGEGNSGRGRGRLSYSPCKQTQTAGRASNVAVIVR